MRGKCPCHRRCLQFHSTRTYYINVFFSVYNNRIIDIKYLKGYADFMVAGGTEACMDPLAVAGFAKMRALSKSMDPRTASRPFDADRNGFVMGVCVNFHCVIIVHTLHCISQLLIAGEGSGLLVLESLESARYRNAKIIAEIVGYGMSGIIVYH